jgi:polynucleotide 5'-triphosphatase
MEEYRRFEPVDMKPKVNGDHRFPSSSPKQPPKKRIRHTEPPIWAQSVRAKGIHREAIKGPPKSNGKAPMAQDGTNGTRIMPPAPTLSAPAVTAVNIPVDHALLGLWEPSIVGTKPNDQITKLVADFLYMHVVSRGDLGELASRGVVVEIEAKLGQLIDKETNERYRLPVLSECVLHERTNVGFRSSMTEVY